VIGLSHPISVSEILSTMHGIVQNSISCRKHKHAPILGDATCHGRYGSKPVTSSELSKHSDKVSIPRVQTTVVRLLQQMKRPETKTVDEHETERKATCTEVSKLPYTVLFII
jgi:hypothetical protein